jgi:hypothetical protein
MYAFINFLRSVVWTAVGSVVLVAAAIINALFFNDPFTGLTLAASAVALAVLSRSTN